MSSLLSRLVMLLLFNCRGRCGSEPQVSEVRGLHRLMLLLLLHREISISVKT